MPVSIPDKTKWQGYKKQFGIPDGLSKVKMGDAFQTYRTTENALSGKRNYDANLTAIEKLIVVMTQYAIDLKKTSPDKFGGKTLTEKHAHYHGANDLFKEIFGAVSALKKNYFSLARPLDGVRETLAKAEAKFKSLNGASSKDDYEDFYREQFRGVNLPLQQLAQVTTDQLAKAAIKAFMSEGNVLNAMLNGHGEFDKKEFHGHAATALAILERAFARH